MAQDAPLILKTNKDRISRAIVKGKEILAKIQETGMNDDLVEVVKAYLQKSSATLKAIKSDREPITQALQAVSKEFTVVEQQLDPKRDTIHSRLQKCLDDYAKKLAEVAEKRERERLQKINEDREVTTLGANVQEHVKKMFNEHVYQEKEGLRSIFDDITLDAWNETIAIINGHRSEISNDLFHSWALNYSPIYISLEETKGIIRETMDEMRDVLEVDLQKEIGAFKQDLSNEYRAKKNELEAIASTNEAERIRLEKEASERKLTQSQGLLKEKEDADNKASLDSNSQIQQQELEFAFEEAEAKANVPQRTGYSILLTHQKGWLPIMNLWFEKEGIEMPLDRSEKMTLARMKAFCENYAHKNDEILQSPYLKYDEEFKQKAK